MNWAAKDRSEIALNTIWSEHVEKESKILKRSIKTTYTCNPCASIPMNNGLGMRMASVTEKVGYAVGLEPVEIGEDPDVNAVVSGLLGAQKVPTEKYSEPITSAQEVGWYSKPLVAANPRFVHGLKQAEATEVRRCITHGNRLFPVPSSVPGDLRRSDTCTCLLFRVLMLNPRSLLKHTQRRWQGSTCFMARVANTSGFRLWTSSLPSLSTGIRLQLQPHYNLTAAARCLSGGAAAGARGRFPEAIESTSQRAGPDEVGRVRLVAGPARGTGTRFEVPARGTGTRFEVPARGTGRRGSR